MELAWYSLTSCLREYLTGNFLSINHVKFLSCFALDEFYNYNYLEEKVSNNVCECMICNAIHSAYNLFLYYSMLLMQ